MAILNLEVQGIPVDVDENVFNDFELMMMLGKLEATGNSFLFPAIAEKIYGEEQLKAIRWQMEKDDGFWRADRMIEFIHETIGSASEAKVAGDGKNS